MARNENGYRQRHRHRHRRLLSMASLLTTIIVLLMSMSIESASSGYGYKMTGPEKSDAPRRNDSQRMPSTAIGVQGVIYCRSGTKLTPIQGALARISCLAIDKRGYETAPFAILSRPADANGYFFAALSPSEVEDGWRLSECKAFLHSSPAPTCAVPTDVKRGVTGALLSSHTLRDNGKMKLYSVGPFVYAPGPAPSRY